ncbi:MAG TPA: CHRD domain-containing protein [Gammaproteobacteria bacterium]
MKGYPAVNKLCLLAPSVVLLGTAVAQDDGADDVLGEVTVRLIGYNEVPSVSTPARGMFAAQVDEAASTITYTLQYDPLSGDVTQAHLHLGERHTNGGISVWLCSNLTDPPPPAGTQACPPGPAEISGTITPEQVGGPMDQGIAAGEFVELLEAMRAGAVYVNVHSTTHPGGEIRAQLLGPRDDPDDSDGEPDGDTGGGAGGDGGGDGGGAGGGGDGGGGGGGVGGGAG